MKKRSHSDIIGGQGIALITRRALEMGYVFRETGWDAGIDGHIEIRDAVTGEMSNRIIQVQSKASDRPFTAETDTSFEYMCAENDLRYWVNGNAPVILVCSHPAKDEAYWVPLKEYFTDPKRRKERRVCFDKSAHKLSLASKDALARLAMPVAAGLYLGPRPRSEALRSNLLRVAAVPEEYFTARTDLRTPQECIARLREQSKKAPRGWILRDKLLYSFYDLSEQPWSSICDGGTVEAHHTSTWALEADRDKQRRFLELLSAALTDQLFPKGISFSRPHGYYYFRATPDLGPREYQYRSRKKAASRTVFKGYPKKTAPDEIGMYRHAAFEGRFERFGDDWYLMVAPTYHFTRDGYAPSRYGDAWVSGQKRLEHNESVDGQVAMWAALLRESSLFHSPLLRFDDVLSFELDAGVDDEAWLKIEPVADTDEDSDQLQLL